MGAIEMIHTQNAGRFRVARCWGAALLVLAAGCQDNHLYSWGTYEGSIRSMYADRGTGFKPQEEVARLAGEVRKTVEENRKVPPGKYAHLGYLCYVSGDMKAARSYFDAEKAAFPEGGKLVDRFVERLP